MTEATVDARALIEQVAKALVDAPGEVLVEQFEEEGETVLELTVAEPDEARMVARAGCLQFVHGEDEVLPFLLVCGDQVGKFL